MKGTPRMQQEFKNCFVRIAIPNDKKFALGGEGWIWVRVGNYSSTPMHFGLENVEFTCEGKTLKKVTYEEQKRRIETHAAMAALAAGLAAGAQSAGASMQANSYTSGSYSGTAGTYRPVNYSGTYTGTTTTYNPAATAQAQAAIQRNLSESLNDISDASSSNIAELQYELRLTTINPGESYCGIATFKLPSTSGGMPKTITATVRIGGQTAAFPILYQ